ncbi:hypothetical protein [Rhizobium leguminosarum]|uniref:hypothetical protein n=1 Tax=Rhizobium leguminosarum TaxID=384 RepID=UPI0021BBFEA3|nr:hypothetical protein [Rhizobium leguminosarum]
MDQVTQQNAAMAEESTAASTALAIEAKQLRGIVAGFQIENALSEQQTSQRKPGNSVNVFASTPDAGKVANALGTVSDGRVADESRQ